MISSSTASPAQASAGPSDRHVDCAVASDSDECVTRQVVRKQELEGKEYTVSKFAELLRGPKTRVRHDTGETNGSRCCVRGEACRGNTAI
jgi:spore germination protein GerM